MSKDRCLIIFVKYPEKGKVKSRLAQHLKDIPVAELYENFIRDIIATMLEGFFKLRIYFYPSDKEKEIKASFGEKYDYAIQNGADLGERMKNAFVQEFAAGFESVVLIGSDCPDLSLDIIAESFRVLEDKSNTVIGPSVDGGYYLIGFRKNAFCPDVFSGPQWGKSSVLEETTNVLYSQGKQLHILPAWRDIDTREDLDDLIKRSEGKPFADSKTIKFLTDKISSKS